MRISMHAPRAAAALALACGIAGGLAACGGGGTADGSAVGALEPTAPQAGEAPAPGAAPAPATADSTPTPPLSARAPMLGDCELFPAQAIFNTRIDDPARFPPDARSAGWIASVGPATPMRADWWRGEDPTQRGAYYGMPINLVDGSPASTDWAAMNYDLSTSGLASEVGWPHESDCAVADGSGGHALQRGCGAVAAGERRFPIPTQNLRTEGGSCNDPNSCGDHHLLVVEQGACRLWEGFSSYNLGGQWYSLATAAWDLKSLALRPLGWTAADAAGLPITPLLVKAAEAGAGEIRHALRVTLRDGVLARSLQWPARHFAGDDTPGGIPFGALLRLRADFVIPESWTTQAKAIATAAKRYGLYVADIGMDFYVQGEPSAQWDEATFGQVASIPLSQMEFVDLGAVTGDPRFSQDSMAARWN